MMLGSLDDRKFGGDKDVRKDDVWQFDVRKLVQLNLGCVDW